MSNASDTARAWVDVDLAALTANARTVAGVAGARLLPMIKANGYGLGAVPVARALEAVDPWGFGVATIAEGAELRAAGISRPIIVFTALQPADVDGHLADDLRPTISDLAALDAWTGRGGRPFHLEIDTGMARAGFRPDALGDALARAAAAPGWEGIFTHFHSAETDPASVEGQWERFNAVLATAPRRPPLVHAANSAAALQGARYAADLVRPGIFLYGGHPGAHAPAPAVVARLRARVIGIRTVPAGETVSYGATWTAPRATAVATLALGYADGYLRSGSNHGVVELNGAVAPVVGRVTMDMTLVAPPSAGVALGDVATIFGGLISLDEQAAALGTISYELLTGLSRRVVRRYGETA